MPSKLEILQEIADRGAQDQLPPEKRAVFDELVSRGAIKAQQPQYQPQYQPQQQTFDASQVFKQSFPFLAKGAVQGVREVGQGIRQLAATPGLATGGGYGVTPEMLASQEQAQKEITQEIEAQRQAFAQSPEGQSPLGQIGRFLGGAAPYAAIPQAAPTAVGRVAAGGGLGAIMGGMQFVPEGDSRGMNIALGAGLGAAVPAAIEVGRRITPKRMLAQVAKEGVETVLPRNQRILDRLGIKGAPVGARTSTLSVIQAEQAASQNAPITYIREINNYVGSVKKGMDKVLKDVSRQPGKIGHEKAGDIIFKRGREAVSTLKDARKAQWDTDWLNVQQAAGDYPTFSPNKFADELSSIYSEITGASKAGINKAGPIGKRLARDLEAGNGKLTAEQIKNYMSDFSAMSKGKGLLGSDLQDPQAKREVGARLIKAVSADLDDYAAQGGNQKAIVDSIKSARANYKTMSGPIDEVLDSSLGKLIDKDSASPREVAEAVIAMKPSSAQSLLKKLDELSPEAAGMARGLKLQKAINNMFEVDPKKATEIKNMEPKKFFDEFRDIEVRKAWFKNPKDYRRVSEAVRAMQVIGTHSSSAAAGQGLESAAQKGIAAVTGMHPVFLALNAAKLVSPRVMQKNLLTREGQDSIITIAKALKGGPKYLRKANIPAIEAAFNYLQEEPNGNQVQQ